MKHQATVGSSDLSASKSFVSLVDLLIDRAQQQPIQKAYTFLSGGDADELTYAALDLKARSIAAQLQSLNLAGERALLLYPPGLEYIAAFFGCLYAQVVAVPAYPPRRNQNLSRLQAIVADSQPKVVLTTAALKDSLQSRFAQELNLTDLHWLGSDIDSNGAEDWQSPPDSDTLAFLQYTSGSTGNPKGVMISHGNLLHNLEMIHTCFAHNADSRGFIWLPPYHDMGLIGGVLQPLYGGFPVTLMSPVDFLQKPFRWLQAISHYQATTSGGPNFAYDLCVQKTTPEQRSTLDLSHWEVAFTGAEPVRAETLDRFAEAFEPYGFRKAAFYPCYGMAEATLIISGGLKTNLPTVRQIESVALEQNRVVEVKESEESRSVVSCGWSWLGQEVLIVDPDTRLVCEENRVGEIWVSGASIAQGYWHRADETQQAFHAHLATGAGPLMRTGDLGFYREGELFITGRLKDVIIIRGQNHYPHDVELTVAKSHPALRLNCGAAFAVEIKGAERLVIVQEVERSYLRKLNVEEVVSSIRQEVVAQHGLEIYATVLVKTGSIPKTSSGKIRRHACRTMFQAGSLEVVDDWSENPQGTSKFLNLQAEVESMLQKLQVNKRN